MAVCIKSMRVRKNKKPSTCSREEEGMVNRGQKECLRLKERLRGEKQMGATGLGGRAGAGRAALDG